MRCSSILSLSALALTSSLVVAAPPYNFAALDALLESEASSLMNHYAIIVRQDGREIYRAQLGDIEYDTKLGIASLTKTLSAAVVLRSAELGEIALSDTLGSLVPILGINGLGAPTVIDCFGMRHGITTPWSYELLPLTLGQSILAIAQNGVQAFPPNTVLYYDGNGMQSVGFACESRAGLPWDTLAATRVLLPCEMTSTDYEQFAPNPAIAGGARSSATDIDRFGQMIMAGGVYKGTRVLQPSSIEQLFTNATDGLPVEQAPFPPGYPLYQYGEDPDYGFGAWVFAHNPVTLEVEEVLGAGAWGSSLWLDRRRGISATFITDVPGFSNFAIDAALGLQAIMRQQIEAYQATSLLAFVNGADDTLVWIPSPGSTGTRVYALDEPIRDLFDLRRATLVAEVTGNTASISPRGEPQYYAAIALFDGVENPAIIPGVNTRKGPTHCAEDLDGNGFVGPADLVFLLGAWGTSGPGDLDGDGVVGAVDLASLLASWGPCTSAQEGDRAEARAR